MNLPIHSTALLAILLFPFLAACISGPSTKEYRHFLEDESLSLTQEIDSPKNGATLLERPLRALGNGSLPSVEALDNLLSTVDKIPGAESLRHDIQLLVCAGFASIGKSDRFHQLSALVPENWSEFPYVDKCHECDGTGRHMIGTGAERKSRICMKCKGKGMGDISRPVAWREFEHRVFALKQEVVARELHAWAIAGQMRAWGMVDVSGKFMPPGSLRNAGYLVFQVTGPGRALCLFEGTDHAFFLLYSPNANRPPSLRDLFKNDLHRCGSYSYLAQSGGKRTIPAYAIDLKTALEELGVLTPQATDYP